MRSRLTIICLSACCAQICLCLLVVPVRAADVLVLSSSDILPYTRCIEGIRESLESVSVKLLTMDADIERGRREVAAYEGVHTGPAIAVGPQAAYVLAEFPSFEKRLFCMVLNPARLFQQTGLFAGISLNIPVRFQVTTIKKAFPDRSRIGIFYSGESNRQALKRFSDEALRVGMRVIGFPIGSAQDIPPILKSQRFAVDVLLFIPDEVFRSTKIIDYVIEEALRRRIPVVGYNSWYANNGALLSFVIDYNDVGRQAGEMAQRMLQTDAALSPEVVPPVKIRVFVDQKTAGKLGIAVSPGIVQTADEVLR